MSSEEIRAKISALTEEKTILEEKIAKLIVMIAKLEDPINVMNGKIGVFEEIKPIYSDFISAADFSYGTLIDYMNTTAEAKQLRFNQFGVSMVTWVDIFNKELLRANELLSSWQTKVKSLEIQIYYLTMQLEQALALGM